MRVVALFITALLSVTVFSQEAPKPSSTAPGKSEAVTSCGNGHTVDDYLAEKNKLRKRRNRNPLPTDTCIWGWCRDTSKIPTSTPPEEIPATPPAKSPLSPSATNESTSKPAPGPTCDPYSAAQDVEVGDFYYGDKSYRAALSRYESALSNKPGDPGILLRLGKTAEKLADNDRAKREYQASIDAAPDQPSAKEAQAAIERITSLKPSR